MALINCQECGKDMSDTAFTCPHCGAPKHQSIGYTEGRKGRGVGGGVFCILVGIGLLIFSFTSKAPRYASREILEKTSDIQNALSLFGVIVIIIGIWAISFFSKSKTKE